MSINVPGGASAYISLTGATTYMSIVQTHNGFADLYSISRNGVTELQAGSKLSMQSNFDTQNLRWSSFRLDNCFSPLYAFRVARTSSLASTATVSILVTYDLVLLNIGLAWNAVANSFKAPLAGQYFFSLSIGMSSQQLFVANFEVNGVIIQSTYSGAAAKISSGNDLYTVSNLLQLNSGDVFTTTCYNGTLYSDSTNLQISLSGFFYSPVINSKVSMVIAFSRLARRVSLIPRLVL